MPPEAPKNLQPIVIFGAGGLGREILLLLHQINDFLPTWNILGFYDDNALLPSTINNYPFLGSLKTLQERPEKVAVAIAIGDPRAKARIAAALSSETFYFPVLRHPSVSDAPYQFNQIGAGTIICQGCILTTNISIGRHVLLNLACTVGHDAVIGDFAALMPHVDLAGNACLETGVYLGTKATVLPGVRIGENTVVGAGAVVTRDLPAHCTAVGVPATVIKHHER